MSLDPNKTYLIWNGTEFPNSTSAQFKAPAGSTIDWGDGTVETFNTASATVNTHTYTDGKTEHTIAISGLTAIVDYAFYACKSLTSVTMGNSVTNIGSYTFVSCSSLTSVTIPDSVTSIDDYTFANCSSLTSVTIPNSVTSIGSTAFANCSSLTQLILFPSTPPTLGSNAIPSTIQSIYVQQSSKVAYQAATNWTTFSSKIVSDNIYLSFVRFNQKNKEYIDGKISESTPSSSVNVVQTTGSSETDVMSQKAVTNSFLPVSSISQDIYYVEKDVNFLSTARIRDFGVNNRLSILNEIPIDWFSEGLTLYIYAPSETGRMSVEPNSNPTETSLVTVSSTGTHAYKKVSELVAAENITYPLGANNPYKSGIEYSGNDDAYIKIYSASNYIQVKRNSININSIDPININGSVYIVGDNASLHCKEYVVYTDEGGGFFKLPTLTGYYYFTPAPNTAPTEPSVVVNAVDRTPTWKPISELGGGGNALKVTVW